MKRIIYTLILTFLVSFSFAQERHPANQITNFPDKKDVYMIEKFNGERADIDQPVKIDLEGYDIHEYDGTDTMNIAHDDITLNTNLNIDAWGFIGYQRNGLAQKDTTTAFVSGSLSTRGLIFIIKLDSNTWLYYKKYLKTY